MGLKSKVWCYEKEYRLIYEHGDCHQKLPSNIVSITFGLKMKLLHKATIRRALQDLDTVEYYDAIQPKGELVLRYEPADEDF